MNNIDNQEIEKISRIIGEKLTGSNITAMFQDLGFTDFDLKQNRPFTSTKWRRINESLLEKCINLKSDRPVLNVIEYVSKPSNYVDSPTIWNDLKRAINSILIFKGYELQDDGYVYTTKAVKTLNEAHQRLKSLKDEISSLTLHPEVTKYCKEELLQENYFHAVFEACKGLFDRIRKMSDLTLDGYPLINNAFNFEKPPYQPKIFIQGNSLKTQDEKNQYYGLVNSIKTCLYLYRNHQAHIPKIYDELSLNDAIRGLILVSLSHELLDHCVSLVDLH